MPTQKKKKMSEGAAKEVQQGVRSTIKGVAKGSLPNALRQPTIFTALRAISDSPTPLAVHLEKQINEMTSKLGNAMKDKTRKEVQESIDKLERELKAELRNSIAIPMLAQDKLKEVARKLSNEVEAMEEDVDGGAVITTDLKSLKDGNDEKMENASEDEYWGEVVEKPQTSKPRETGFTSVDSHGEMEEYIEILNEESVSDEKLDNISDVEAPSTKNQTELKAPEENKKSSATVKNPYKTTSEGTNAWKNDPGNASLKDVIMNEHQSDGKRGNMIRVRLSFDCRQHSRNDTAFAEEAKRILVSLDRSIKRR